MPVDITRIEEIGDASQARIVLDQAGSLVSAPLDGVGLYSTSDILAGTWTPTLTSVANVDSTTAFVCHYIRIGDHVMCFGVLTVDPTAAADTLTQVGISLPIASDLGATTDLRGTATTALAQRGGNVAADTSNNRATLSFSSQVTAATGFSFTFGYQII